MVNNFLSFSGVTNINSWRVKSALSNVVSLGQIIETALLPKYYFKIEMLIPVVWGYTYKAGKLQRKGDLQRCACFFEFVFCSGLLNFKSYIVC